MRNPEHLSAVRSLKRRYIAAFGVIGLVVIWGQVIVQTSLQRNLGDLDIARILGEQRRLGEMVVMRVLGLEQASSIEVLQKERTHLQDAMAFWANRHKEILYGNANVGLSQIRSSGAEEILSRMEGHFEALFDSAQRAVLALGDDLSALSDVPPSLAMTRAHEQGYISSIDALVAHVEKEVESRVRTLRRTELFLGSTLLLVLLLEGVFVLRPAVRRIQEEVFKIIESKERMEQLSLIDPLTGIPNRRSFDEVFQMEWRRAVRHSSPLAVIMADIDYFKKYNDTYGHQTGDYCLKQVAAALNKTAKRAGDMVARYGGEEFIVLLINTDIYGAIAIAEQMCLGVEGLHIPHESSLISDRVTLSMGIASMVPISGMVPATFISAADEALYLAKDAGRNQTVATVIDADHIRHSSGVAFSRSPFAAKRSMD